MANPNIFQALVPQPRSAIEYGADMDRADALRTQNALQSLTLRQQADTTQQGLEDRNALRRIAATAGGDRNALISGLRKSGSAGLMSQADALEQTGAKLGESQAKAAKDNADAGKTTQEAGIALHQQHLQALSTVQTPEDAYNWMISGVQSGALPRQGLESGLQKLQQAAATPDGFAQWKQGTAAMGLTVQQQMEMTTPKPTEVRLGNVVKTVDMNPRSKTFGQEVTPSQAIGVSPDTVANNATSRANNAATIAGEDRRAGIMPGGGISPDMETTAKAIASGQLQPPSGMALVNPKNQRILARVMEINPDYDSTTVTAKKKAASDFTSGTLGNSMRSFAVAGQHLDQLGKLVDGLNNGNLQIVNQVGNAYAAQTGNPAPTNFDAAKDVVSKEVVKAIVAGGGGVAEREELSKLMSNAKSPAQLKGVIQQYRSLMGAQHDALLEQRRAAGLPDSTMPNYAGPEAPAATQAANIPPDIAAIMAKHGKPGAK